MNKNYNITFDVITFDKKKVPIKINSEWIKIDENCEKLNLNCNFSNNAVSNISGLLTKNFLELYNRIFTKESLENLDGKISLDDKMQQADFAVILCGKTDNLLMGIADIGADPSFFKRDENKNLQFGWQLNRHLNEKWSRSMLFIHGGNINELWEKYADYLKKLSIMNNIKIKLPAKAWNSWDYYAAAISMDDVENEAAQLKEISADPDFYCVIDDGWQNQWGVWSNNRKFPETTAEMVQKIKKYGFKTGIWVAPMQVSLWAPFARKHQNYFLRKRHTGGLICSDTGSPCGPVLLPDLNNPEMVSYLHDTFKRLSCEGVELFKIDYIYWDFLNLLQESTWQKGTIAYSRKLFQIIRDAVGPDTLIINCGAPQEAGLGIADSSRTGYDIHNFWGHILRCTAEATGRYWQNRKIWTCDPDFAIVRCKSNTKSNTPLNMPYEARALSMPDCFFKTWEPKTFWMAGPEATENEMMLWLSFVRIYGGAAALSDSLIDLHAPAIQKLQKIFLPTGVGRPDFDTKSNLPEFWYNDKEVAIFNYDDKDSEFIVKAEGQKILGGHAIDFWSDKEVNIFKPIILPPHSSLVLSRS